MSRTNKTRYVTWHKTCSCKCRLDVTVCNNKQRWNNAKCRCECKESIDKGKCDDVFFWNPSACECECDKSYNFDEYLDYASCKCGKKLIDKLVLQCEDEILNTTDTISTADTKQHVKIVVLFTLFYWKSRA